jgi:hypothetical protein
MKIATILSVGCAAVVLTSVGLAASYDELAAKGYRWVTVDGPYGCPSKDDLRQITKNRTDEIELRMVEQLRAYYLIPGGIVRLVHQDAGHVADPFSRNWHRSLDPHYISQQASH